MDPNDQNQNPMEPTNVPQGPAPDDGQGVPGQDVPKVPPLPTPTGEGQGEEELPSPPPVETPSGLPAGDNGSPQTA